MVPVRSVAEALRDFEQRLYALVDARGALRSQVGTWRGVCVCVLVCVYG